MTLSEQEVLILALSDVDPKVEVAREEHKKLKLHYYGTGKTEYLSQIQGLENDAQKELRDKFAVTNEFLTNNLLRPMDGIWSAKGGASVYNFTDKDNEDTFRSEKLQDVRSGMPLDTYMQSYWQPYFITDPNGLMFIENDEEGTTAVETNKSITQIKNQTFEGVRPQYVVFEPHEVTMEEIKDTKTSKVINKEIKKLWVVDDSFYYLVQIEDDNAIIVDTKENPYDVVPGTFNSLIFNTEKEIKSSPISNLIDLLDKYLNNNSIKEIYIFLMGYPILWMYAQPCKECSGMGEVNNEHGEGSTQCPSCGGSKFDVKRDVSDIYLLRPPEGEEQTLAPDVAGYIQPDLETWGQMNDELDRTWDLMYFSFWGTSVEKQENETATGRFIDVQPVNNRLNQLSDIAEKIINEHVKLLATFYYPKTYKKSSVNTGRRFLIETPDQIWEKYIKSKTESAPVTTLDEQLAQYYESEYQKNEPLQMFYEKIIKVEPFIHNSNEEINDLPIAENDKARKFYFTEWVKTKTKEEIVLSDVKSLNKQLDDFVNLKLKDNGTE